MSKLPSYTVLIISFPPCSFEYRNHQIKSNLMVKSPTVGSMCRHTTTAHEMQQLTAHNVLECSREMPRCCHHVDM